MATIVEKTIGTGGDYTTLQSWEDACPANLVTADQIWRGKVKNQEFSGTSSLLTISGTTVDSTRYVELTTDTGASFLDHANVRTNALRYNAANGAAIKTTVGWANAVTVSQSYTRISKLQIAGTATNAIGLTILSPATGCDVNQCILETVIAGGLHIENGGAIAHHVRNTVFASHSVSGSAYLIDVAGDINLTNVTAVNTTGTTLGYGMRCEYGTANLKNVYFGGAFTTFTGGAGSTFNKTTCFTNVSGPPSGWSAAALTTATFESVTDASLDLRLKAGSALIDAGTTDATYAASDISGTARSGTYDVGAWEVASADTTAPTLTSQSVTSVGVTTATGNVTTDEGNGTLYGVVTTSATAPSAAQIQAGQNHTGAAAVWSGNQAISSTGAKTLSITGLTASTAYYAHFQHKDSANNNSSVVTSAQFTTSGVDASAPGTTLTGTSSLTAGGASGSASGTASGANLTGTSSLAAGSATGTATGSFTTAAMENNTGAGLLANTAVEWTLYYGTIGSAPSDMAHGSGTTNASGVLSGSGVPLGAADLWVRTPDGVGIYYQRITVA